MTSSDSRPMPAAIHPLRELLFLAMPTIAQMASYLIMQFIDAWMLAKLGGLAPTAASNSGMIAFSVVALGMGAITLVNTLVSQSFGRRDYQDCGKFMWQGIWFGLFFGACIIPLTFAGDPLFALFHHPPELAAMESTYWSIVMLTAPVKLFSNSTGNFFLGINRPGAVLAAAFIGVSTNAVAAWCVVLGHWGFTSHGIAGAAWSQNLGVTVELGMSLSLAMMPRVRRKFGTLDARFCPAAMITLIKVGVPSGFQWFSDVLAWSVFCNGVLGRLGPIAMQANTFTLRYMVIAFMPIYGLSVAVTALVGRYIGAGTPDIGARRAFLGQGVATLYAILCGIGFVAGRRLLLTVFTHDPEVLAVGAMYLIAISFYELFDSLFIIYMGALRGAGDTLVPTVVTATICWTMLIGGGFAITSTHIGWIGPWIVACVYSSISGLYLAFRFHRGGWRNIRLASASGAIPGNPAISNVAPASATLPS